VLTQIVESTDGVPLFVEELVKTVLESGVLREVDGQLKSEGVLTPIAVPTTLKDSLMARLDRLSSVKAVAQAGACIGGEFQSSLLASIIGADGLADKLDQLVNAGLIFRRGSGDRTRYRFKHALVQDAAHESLLVSRRRELHGRIAETIAASDDPDPAIENGCIVRRPKHRTMTANGRPNRQSAAPRTRNLLYRPVHSAAVAGTFSSRHRQSCVAADVCSLSGRSSHSDLST